jgi:hypothetical protein
LYVGTYTTCGDGDSILMTCAGGDSPCTTTTCCVVAGFASTVTFCCSVVFKFPVACAFCRSRWIAFIMAVWSSINASPSLVVHSSSLLIIWSTCGNATSDLTLASQSFFSSSLVSSSPLTDLFPCTQRSA